MTTNSKIKVNNSAFLENYSAARGSILFGEDISANAKFSNSNFTSNYAELGGIFFVQ